MFKCRKGINKWSQLLSLGASLGAWKYLSVVALFGCQLRGQRPIASAALSFVAILQKMMPVFSNASFYRSGKTMKFPI